MDDVAGLAIIESARLEIDKEYHDLPQSMSDELFIQDDGSSESQSLILHESFYTLQYSLFISSPMNEIFARLVILSMQT